MTNETTITNAVIENIMNVEDENIMEKIYVYAGEEDSVAFAFEAIANKFDDSVAEKICAEITDSQISEVSVADDKITVTCDTGKKVFNVDGDLLADGEDNDIDVPSANKEEDTMKNSVVKNEEKVLVEQKEEKTMKKNYGLIKKQGDALITLVKKHISVEGSDFDKIEDIKVNNRGVLVSLKCGDKCVFSFESEKNGIVPTHNHERAENVMIANGYRGIFNKKQLESFFFDYCVSIAMEEGKEIRKLMKDILLREKGKVEITNKKVFEDTNHELLSREDKAFYCSSIHLEYATVEEKLEFDSRTEEQKAMDKVKANKKYYKDNLDVEFRKDKNGWYLIKNVVRPIVKASLQSCDWNRRAALLPIGKERVTVFSFNGDTQEAIVDRYSKAYIILSLNDRQLLPYIEERINGKLVPKKIYKFGKGRDERWLVTDPYQPDKLYSLTTGITVDKKEWLKKYKDKYLVYNSPELGLATATAGQIKQYALTCPVSNLPSFDWEKVMDMLTYGGSKKLILNPYTGTAENTAKTATRMSQSDAPAKSFDNIGTFAIFMGKFADSKGNEFADGLSYWATESAAKTFSNSSNRFEFSVNVVEGSAAQMRPYNCKVLASILRREVIQKVMSNYAEPEDIIYLERGKITAEDQAEFDKCFGKDKKSSKFWGKTIILCDVKDNAEVNFYTDLNGLKFTFDLTRQSTCNVLKISSQHKSLKDGSTTSTQVLSSLSCTNSKRTEEIVKRLSDKAIAEKFEKLGFFKDESGEIQYQIPESLDSVSYDMVSDDSIDLTTLLSQVCPEIVSEIDFNTYKRVAEKSLEGLVTSANELSFPTEGVYCLAVCDYSMIVAMQRVLGITDDGCVECFSPAMNKNGIEKAIGVKFPKMGINEFAKFVPVSLEEIKNRLAKLVNAEIIDRKTANNIYRIYKNTSNGVVVIPAVEILKNLLAGMDFDGDAIQLYFNKEIVEVFWSTESIAVVIDKSDLEVLRTLA